MDCVQAAALKLGRITNFDVLFLLIGLNRLFTYCVNLLADEVYDCSYDHLATISFFPKALPTWITQALRCMRSLLWTDSIRI